jgi:hypothetical protein
VLASLIRRFLFDTLLFSIFSLHIQQFALESKQRAQRSIHRHGDRMKVCIDDCDREREDKTGQKTGREKERRKHMTPAFLHNTIPTGDSTAMRKKNICSVQFWHPLAIHS